ncbi:MAG: cytochrome B [Rubrivivax sp.]|nr:cytochrome B [Rubrivivax sp.]
MVVGWGVLLPVGALVARYFKVTGRQRWPDQLDNKAWWHAHRALQWSGIAVMSVGALIAWLLGVRATPLAAVHGWAGWALVAMGWLQVIAGLARGSKGGPTDARLRGDHYDMTPYRQAFERLHKGLGWLTVLLAAGVIAGGLVLADAPRWMPLVLAAWWLALGWAAWRWQAQGRCIDTYQAIWGPDRAHPGNRIRPIGWGVRRPLD